MSGPRVIAALVAIVLATAIVPPGAAWAVNRYRLAQAAADVAGIAEQLRSVPDATRASLQPEGILHGPGRMPVTETPSASGWTTAPRGNLPAAPGAKDAVLADPWGNCYLSNATWVLSAGPNGIVDTPFVSTAPGPSGDDVAARVR